MQVVRKQAALLVRRAGDGHSDLSTATETEEEMHVLNVPKLVDIDEVLASASASGNNFIFEDDGDDPVWEFEDR